MLSRCLQGGCIPKNKVCDFNADCMAGDASDETNCAGHPGRCDFEHGLCLYTQSSDDEFDWTVATDGTFSYGTGPATDHTTGSKKGTSLAGNDLARVLTALLQLCRLVEILRTVNIPGNCSKRKQVNKPVSQSCAVAKTRRFWRATGQSNLEDRREDCSASQFHNHAQ